MSLQVRIQLSEWLMSKPTTCMLLYTVQMDTENNNFKYEPSKLNTYDQMLAHYNMMNMMSGFPHGG